MNLILNYLVFLNGIYDLLCALFILLFPNTIIGKIHSSIFKNQINNRLLAYWIVTYGFTRLFILQQNKTIDLIIAITYFCEAFAYGYEYIYYNTTIKYKTTFVSISSLIIGSLILCSK